MPDFAVTFDDWSKGEYGELGSRRAGRQGPGFFHGSNVWPYRDGLLGPRPGVKALTMTSMPNGKPRAVGFYQAGTTGRCGWWWANLADKKVYDYDIQAQTVSASYVTPAVTNPAVYEMLSACSLGDATSYLTTVENPAALGTGGLWRVDHNLQALTAAGASSGTVIRFYRSRLLLGGSLGLPVVNNRVVFSDIGSYGTASWETFGPFAYFDGFETQRITGLHDFGDGLLITQANGDILLYTGALGSAAAFLRRVGERAAPGDDRKGLMVDSRTLLFWGPNDKYPTIFTGAGFERLEHIQPFGSVAPLNDLNLGMTRLEEPGDWLIWKGAAAVADTGLMAVARRRGALTYHTWGVAGVTDMGGLFPLDELGTLAAAHPEYGGVVILPTFGADAAVAPFYGFNASLDRPGFTSDTLARPGDGSDTPVAASFNIPEWWDDQGRDVRAEQLIIDFRKWNTGSATANEIGVKIRALDRSVHAAYKESATKTWTEAGASASVSGTDDRWELQLGDQGHGGGFEVYVTSLKGAAIRSITVLGSVDPARV